MGGEAGTCLGRCSLAGETCYEAIIPLTAFSIAELMSVLCRSFRLRFLVFLVRIWLFIERRRTTRPLAVVLKRLLAPRCDFCFGTMSPRRPLSTGLSVITYPGDARRTSTRLLTVPTIREMICSGPVGSEMVLISITSAGEAFGDAGSEIRSCSGACCRKSVAAGAERPFEGGCGPRGSKAADDGFMVPASDRRIEWRTLAARRLRWRITSLGTESGRGLPCPA